MWNKESIHALLDKNDKAVFRALQAIYALQLPSEKDGTTQVRNDVGFSKFDAPFLCDVARKSQRYGSLTPNQARAVRRCMKRYWRQLADIANATQTAPQASEAVVPAAQPEEAPCAGMVDGAPSEHEPRLCLCEYSDGEPNVQCLGEGKCYLERFR